MRRDTVDRRLATVDQLSREMSRLRAQHDRLSRRRRRIMAEVKDDPTAGVTFDELSRRVGLARGRVQEQVEAARREASPDQAVPDGQPG